MVTNVSTTKSYQIEVCPRMHLVPDSSLSSGTDLHMETNEELVQSNYFVVVTV